MGKQIDVFMIVQTRAREMNKQQTKCGVRYTEIKIKNKQLTTRA
jgi:hypothetical protein